MVLVHQRMLPEVLPELRETPLIIDVVMQLNANLLARRLWIAQHSQEALGLPLGQPLPGFLPTEIAATTAVPPKCLAGHRERPKPGALPSPNREVCYLITVNE